MCWDRHDYYIATKPFHLQPIRAIKQPLHREIIPENPLCELAHGVRVRVFAVLLIVHYDFN